MKLPWSKLSSSGNPLETKYALGSHANHIRSVAASFDFYIKHLGHVPDQTCLFLCTCGPSLELVLCQADANAENAVVQVSLCLPC